MNNYECIIIDDEPFAIKWLENYINSIPNLKLIKSYTNPMEALMELAAGNTVDLILMDINMPNISGIELSREIRKKTRKLVFSTAHKQYAYDSYELEADAYLLKPYTFSKFAGTIARLFNDNTAIMPEVPIDEDYFFVKNKNDALKMVKIRYNEIIAVESRQNYVLIHTHSKNVLAYMSLTEIGQILQQFRNFEQFQRSFIIQKDHIDTIDGHAIKMVNGLEITVGQHYVKAFDTFLSKKLLVKAGRRK